jgi:hypothetical protein
MTATDDPILAPYSRRREIERRLRRCPWPAVREQLTAALAAVSGELLWLDGRRLDEPRERLTPEGAR